MNFRQILFSIFAIDQRSKSSSKQQQTKFLKINFQTNKFQVQLQVEQRSKFTGLLTHYSINQIKYLWTNSICLVINFDAISYWFVQIRQERYKITKSTLSLFCCCSTHLEEYFQTLICIFFSYAGQSLVSKQTDEMETYKIHYTKKSCHKFSMMM